MEIEGNVIHRFVLLTNVKNGDKGSEKVSENGNVNTESNALEKSEKAEVVPESVVIDDFDGKLARTRICPEVRKIA